MRLPPIYWLNLARSAARRQRMLDRLDGLTHTRVEAVDGRDEQALRQVLRFRDVPPAVAAATASHLRAIKQARADGHREVLVLEDDMTFELLQAWPEGWSRLRNALPATFGAVRLCVVETSRMLDRLYRRREALVRIRKLYWCAGAYLIDRAGMDAVCDAYVRGDGFDVLQLDEEHDPEHVVFRAIGRAMNEGPYDARVPLFIYEAEDSEIHPEHLDRYRRARAFVLEHHPALREGRYRSPFSPLRLFAR